MAAPSQGETVAIAGDDAGGERGAGGEEEVAMRLSNMKVGGREGGTKGGVVVGGGGGRSTACFSWLLTWCWQVLFEVDHLHECCKAHQPIGCTAHIAAVCQLVRSQQN